jgi:hypothetical protein
VRRKAIQVAPAAQRICFAAADILSAILILKSADTRVRYLALAF